MRDTRAVVNIDEHDIADAARLHQWPVAAVIDNGAGLHVGQECPQLRWAIVLVDIEGHPTCPECSEHGLDVLHPVVEDERNRILAAFPTFEGGALGAETDVARHEEPGDGPTAP